MKNLLTLVISFVFFTQILCAQANLTTSNFKRTTATILLASFGGGVLGLSTLSFYGKPQEHADNITTGVLVGFLAGLGYVLYDNYQQPASTFSSEYLEKITPKEPVFPLATVQYSW